MASNRRPSTRGWPRSPTVARGRRATRRPGRPRAAARSRSKRWGGWIEVVQRLVAQARRVEAASSTASGSAAARAGCGRARELVPRRSASCGARLEDALGGVGERQAALAGARRRRAARTSWALIGTSSGMVRSTPSSRWPVPIVAAAQLLASWWARTIACRRVFGVALEHGPSLAQQEPLHRAPAAAAGGPRLHGVAGAARRRRACRRACGPPARAPTAAAWRGRGRRPAAGSAPAAGRRCAAPAARASAASAGRAGRSRCRSPSRGRRAPGRSRPRRARSAASRPASGAAGAAPRRPRVGAQGGGVQALAEDLRGRALGAAHDAHDPARCADAGARLAQRGEHARGSSGAPTLIATSVSSISGPPTSL